MRVIIRKEGEMFVGQCLEHDICAQGCNMNELMERLAFTVALEKEERGGSLDDIDPAPEAFHQIWDASRRFQNPEDGFELALAA